MVRVDVLVTANGRPLTGLAPGDFEVLDNGVAQTVELVSFEQLPLNVVLALDLSESVAGERLAHLTAASRAVLERLGRSDQAALVSFSHLVRLGAGLTADARAVERALEQASPGGETSLVDATYTAMMVGESDVGRALVIVFSDGVDTASWLQPDAVLDIAKRTDVVVYGVSVRRTGTSPIPAGTGRADRRAAVRGGVDEGHRRRVRRHPRGVPPALRDRLHADRRDRRRMAPHHGAHQGEERDVAGASGVPGGWRLRTLAPPPRPA